MKISKHKLELVMADKGYSATSLGRAAGLSQSTACKVIIGRCLLNQIPKNVVEWVYPPNMTDEEKEAHPTYETTGGYLKVLNESECGQLWWDRLEEYQREVIFSLPNFDPDIFEQCTGIKVKKAGKEKRMERIDAKRKIADFMVKEKQPYGFKVKYAATRAREFVQECDRRGLNYHVSVGGLDSITLYMFLKSIGIDCPAISVSFLEDISIQKVHKELGILCLKSAAREDGTHWNKQQIIQEFGFPVLSKDIAGKIETLANLTEKNKTVRHAIITGETGAYGGYQKNSRMKMSKKWLEKFGGYANGEEETDYQIPDFKVSSKCCYYLKEKPCDDWGRENNSVPCLMNIKNSAGSLACLNNVNAFIMTCGDVLHLHSAHIRNGKRNSWKRN